MNKLMKKEEKDRIQKKKLENLIRRKKKKKLNDLTKTFPTTLLVLSFKIISNN